MQIPACCGNRKSVSLHSGGSAAERLPAFGMEVTGAPYWAWPFSHPEVRPVLTGAGAALLLTGSHADSDGGCRGVDMTGAHASLRPPASEEGCAGVAMTGTHALSRPGVAAPGWDGVMPGCIGVAAPCTATAQHAAEHARCMIACGTVCAAAHEAGQNSAMIVQPLSTLPTQNTKCVGDTQGSKSS